jgi:hypothetical protein
MREVHSIVERQCTFCHETGIVDKGEFNLDASRFCVCPTGEKKFQTVAEIVGRSPGRVAYKKTA